MKAGSGTKNVLGEEEVEEYRERKVWNLSLGCKCRKSGCRNLIEKIFETIVHQQAQQVHFPKHHVVWIKASHDWIRVAKSLHIDWNPNGGLTPSCSWQVFFLTLGVSNVQSSCHC